MPTLDELIGMTDIGDDVELIAGNHKFTVGALRARVKAVQDAEKAAASLRAKADKDMADAIKAGEDALALYNRTQEEVRTRAATPAARKDGEIDWDADDIYKPVGARLKPVEERLAKAFEEIEKQQKAFGAAANFMLRFYNEQRWKADPERAKLPMDEYVEYAKAEKIMDKDGLFDPVQAWDRKTAQQRRDAEIKAAEEKGVERGRKLAAQAAMPRPGTAPRVPAASKEPTYKNLQEALAAAATDPDILAIAESTQA